MDVAGVLLWVGVRGEGVDSVVKGGDVEIGRTVHATFEKLKDGREFAAWRIERP